ncbi:hypothetical protein DdX_16467 [Ditylenchus destructor]|uniref:Uncharacterized protein n=1 Tax=Ditylenchus destructor TaxID=166010 RepID=A0AAD4MND6_9BILA|nr:hypothetical protein DdX_16467 [Ditylenchus destructor]
MYCWIRMRAFIIFHIVYFCIPQFQAVHWWETGAKKASGALNSVVRNGQQAFANINHTVDQLAGMTKRIKLFAHGWPAHLNPPEILIPFLTKMAPTNQTPSDTIGWAEKAHSRAIESRDLREAFFAELYHIFPYKMPPKVKDVIDVNGHSITVSYLNEIVTPPGFNILTPQGLHNPDREVTVSDVKPAMKELAFHFIHKEIEGYKGGEITGEPALRIGAALCRALFFVDAAHYKYAREEDHIHLAYPDKFKLAQQPTTVESKQEPSPGEISTVRLKKMHEITIFFDNNWETFKSIMYILGNYQKQFYDAKAGEYVESKAEKRREAEEAKRTAARERDRFH